MSTPDTKNFLTAVPAYYSADTVLLPAAPGLGHSGYTADVTIFRKSINRRRHITLLILLALICRGVLLNASVLNSFTLHGPADKEKIEAVKSARSVFCCQKTSVELLLAMITEDSSESNEEAFSKVSKYPIPLMALTAPVRVFSYIVSNLSLVTNIRQGERLNRHLSFSLLRI